MTNSYAVVLGEEGVVAQFDEDALLPIGAEVPTGLSAPTLQPYLALVLGHEPGETLIDASSSIVTVHGAVVLRDGDQIKGTWLAPTGRVTEDLDLAFTGVLATVDGEVVNSGTGATTYGHPAAALLATQTALEGNEDVSAEVVFAPGLTQRIPVTPGMAYGFEFNDGLGAINLAS